MCFYFNVKHVLHTTAIVSLVLLEVSATEVEGVGNRLVQREIWP
jgi:hypothetical protein